MQSATTAAHTATAAWAKENCDAFTARCLPSNRSTFPFSSQCERVDASPQNTPDYGGSPSALNCGIVSPPLTKVADVARRCLHTPSAAPPPRPVRPIVLIHSPRELLAYRNARPPIYVSCPSKNDSRYLHHRYRVTSGSTRYSSALPSDSSESITCSSPTSKFGSSVASKRLQRPPNGITNFPESTISSVCQGKSFLPSDTDDTNGDQKNPQQDCDPGSAHNPSRKECHPKHAVENHLLDIESRSNFPPPEPSAADGRQERKHIFPDASLSSRYENVRRYYLRRRRISLVPTLGGLHEGHLHLVRQAACLGDEVWVTVFLNPLQFQTGKDFFTYPACIDDDIRLIQQTGLVSVLFVPQREAIFPLDASPTVCAPPALTTFPSAISARTSLSAEPIACKKRKQGDYDPARQSTPLQCHKSSGCTPEAQAGTTAASATADGCTVTKLLRRRERSLNESMPEKNMRECAAFPEVALTSGNLPDSKTSPASSVSTAATTPTGEGGELVHEKEDCYQSSVQTANKSSRLFRMRVFFEDIEDVNGEGKRRPGFFGGIGTVVAQLLTLTRPTYLHAGLKDFQQVLCLKRLICGLGADVLLVAHSTQRHASSGISFASRNNRLSEAERRAASKYYSVLQQVRRAYDGGERRIPQLESVGRQQAEAAGLHMYYITFDRWQDAAPVVKHAAGDGRVGMKPSRSYTVDNATVALAATSNSSSDAVHLENSPQQTQSSPKQQQPTAVQEEVAAQACRLHVEGDAAHAKKSGEPHNHQQLDIEDSMEWRLESPGKYCCTVAVRGNADTTLVDNVTLTDQPQYGDLLPPPLNEPWDRSSAETKHSFFGSFLVLASLGMHMRYLDKDDVDRLLQAEEEDLKSRQDGPQLLLPPTPAEHDAAAVRQGPTESKESLKCCMPQVRGEGEDATIELEELASLQQHEATRGKMEESMRFPWWLSRQRSALFEVGGAASTKTLWIKKHEDTAEAPAADATAAAEQSCYGGSPTSLRASGTSLKNNNKACRVRAMGLFKFDIRDECCSSNSTGARRISYCTRNAGSEAIHTLVAVHKGPEASMQSGVIRGDTVAALAENALSRSRNLDSRAGTTAGSNSCSAGDAGSCSEEEDLREKTATYSEEYKKRERFIGYVWAEEESGVEDGFFESGEKREGCSLVGGATGCKHLRIKRVFLKRERRRQTLGTHLLRAFLAATHKQLLREQQRAVSLRSEQQRLLEAEGLCTQQQPRQPEAHTVKERLPHSQDTEATARKSRLASKEGETQAGAVREAPETERTKECSELKPLCVQGDKETCNGKEGATVLDDRMTSGNKETPASITCTVWMENVPHYLTNVLEEGGFSGVPAAKTMHTQACNGSMHASLAEWYKTFVLSADV